MCNHPNLDLVNMNAYIKFVEILAICYQDIEWKENYDGMMDRMTDNPNFQSGAITRFVRGSDYSPAAVFFHAVKGPSYKDIELK